MDISTTTRTVTEFTITLSDAEAGELLADPAPFQKRLRALRAENSVGKQGARNMTLGRKPRAHKNGKGDANGADPLEKVRCPECSAEIAAKFLPTHREKKHNVARDAASAPTH